MTENGDQNIVLLGDREPLLSYHRMVSNTVKNVDFVSRNEKIIEIPSYEKTSALDCARITRK